MSQGELIAGIAGIVLLIDLWFKWYGVSVSGPGGVLGNFDIGASATAWQAFGLIDIILFLVAIVAIGASVMRAMNRMPEMPYPAATIVTAAGGLALLLIIYRILDAPVDTGGVEGVDVSRKFGLWLGLVAAAGIAYGGWRSMQESGASFGDLSRGAGGTAAPTATMPPATGTGGPADSSPGVPGGGAAGVSPGKEGPGAPQPGTSTGAPGSDPTTGPTPGGSDPVPGETGGQSPPGVAGEPPAPGEETRPPGV